nr:MAG TPA: hypothetical protein [Caudoviricetes sp.]
MSRSLSYIFSISALAFHKVLNPLLVSIIVYMILPSKTSTFINYISYFFFLIFLNIRIRHSQILQIFSSHNRA